MNKEQIKAYNEELIKQYNEALNIIFEPHEIIEDVINLFTNRILSRKNVSDLVNEYSCFIDHLKLIEHKVRDNLIKEGCFK